MISAQEMGTCPAEGFVMRECGLGFLKGLRFCLSVLVVCVCNRGSGFSSQIPHRLHRFSAKIYLLSWISG